MSHGAQSKTYYTPKTLPLPVSLAMRYRVARKIGMKIGTRWYVTDEQFDSYHAQRGDLSNEQQVNK